LIAYIAKASTVISSGSGGAVSLEAAAYIFTGVMGSMLWLGVLRLLQLARHVLHSMRAAKLPLALHGLGLSMLAASRCDDESLGTASLCHFQSLATLLLCFSSCRQW